MNSGLTSVTFRNKSIEDVVSITKKARLSVIEWGSDIHCRPDDISSLEKAKNATQECGLTISSYGSYYRLGTYDDPRSEFQDLCKAASVLGCRVIRIWAYNKCRNAMSQKEYEKCVEEGKTISDIAAEHGITVCFEYHRGTITQNSKSALKLIKDIDRDNIRLYWQPNPDISFESNKTELSEILEYVVNIHCFHWVKASDGSDAKLPLCDGINEWKEYISIAKKANVENILLEFVKDGSDEQLLNDAATLAELV